MFWKPWTDGADWSPRTRWCGWGWIWTATVYLTTFHCASSLNTALPQRLALTSTLKHSIASPFSHLEHSLGLSERVTKEETFDLSVFFIIYLFFVRYGWLLLIPFHLLHISASNLQLTFSLVSHFHGEYSSEH